MRYNRTNLPSWFADWAQDRLRAVSAFYVEFSVSSNTPPLNRTNVYVDGFNLYFGCLKNTSYKWLNLAEFCCRSLPSHFQVQHIRYFTALVPSRTDPQQVVRQQTFIRALQTIPNLTVHYGHFLNSRIWMPLATPPASGSPFVEVLKTEEKGSDVNLATYLLMDAYERDFDAAVVITDDSDLAEPITVVRRRLHHHVTILSPRGKSRQLSLVATRFRQIDPVVLAASQFPAVLKDANGTIVKPAGW